MMILARSSQVNLVALNTSRDHDSDIAVFGFPVAYFCQRQIPKIFYLHFFHQALNFVQGILGISFLFICIPIFESIATPIFPFHCR
ncbi:hypothetical protein BDZ91DRAFT_747522 [Kalaharituber pfeilii]|nr:hypothetical protein BDZ91DRAFT_747522 [Kalaharituber pfeilii]